VSEYAVKPLNPGTWEAFAQLAQRHKGIAQPGFVDRDYRRKGMASVALHDALDLIAQAGFHYVRAS
jgi:hypothetical protein